MKSGKEPIKLPATLLAIAIGTIASALLAEIAVRIFFDEPVQPRFVTDPGYGVRWNQARIDTRHYVPGVYDIRITTNSVGMRGPREYPVERTPESVRIMLLGDSFTFGYGVEDSEVVSAILENDLGNSDRSEVEAINLGVSGFGQAEELITWRSRGAAYRPDAVAILYFDNDIGNNAISNLFSLDAGGNLTRTGAEYLPGSRLQELLFAIAPIRWLFVHSEAWNLIRNRLSILVQNAKLKERGLTSFDDTTPGGVQLTRTLLKVLVSEIRATGAQVSIVVIPNKTGMTSNFPMTAEEVAAIDAKLIDGRTFLLDSDYLPKDGHWRPSGHLKVAKQLATWVDASTANHQGAQAP